MRVRADWNRKLVDRRGVLLRTMPRNEKKACAILFAESLANEVVDVGDSHRLVSLYLLVDELRILEVRREQRQPFCPVPRRLHRGYELGLHERDRSRYFVFGDAVADKQIDFISDFALERLGGQ